MNQEGRQWPITVEDHKEQGLRHAEKQSAVNDALKFPTGSAFDEDLGEILASDAEANGEVVAIALIDCDRFDHINRDFSREAGDKVLVSAGEYIVYAEDYGQEDHYRVTENEDGGVVVD